MFDLGITPRILYLPRKVSCTFRSRDGSPLIASAGSGFVVSSAGSEYLITNRHVVDRAYVNSDHLGTTCDAITVAGFDQVDGTDVQVADEVAHPTIGHANLFDDVSAIRLDAAVRILGPHGARTNLIDEDTLRISASFMTTDRSSSFFAGDLIAILGYPELHVGEQTERPLVLTGFIASDPRYVPEPRLKLSTGHVVSGERLVLYQGFSRPGASGSLVFAVHRGLNLSPPIDELPHRHGGFVGINVGRVLGTNAEPSSLSYFARSDAVLEAIRAADRAS